MEPGHAFDVVVFMAGKQGGFETLSDAARHGAAPDVAAGGLQLYRWRWSAMRSSGGARGAPVATEM